MVHAGSVSLGVGLSLDLAVNPKTNKHVQRSCMDLAL
jgi:hypothetical protein